jgi:glucosamine-6-phosphate deaminase
MAFQWAQLNHDTSYYFSKPHDKGTSTMETISLIDLNRWCRIPCDQLEKNPDLKVPFRLCSDSEELGQIIANDLIEEIKHHNSMGELTRAIIPCGPSCWYKPFVDITNEERVDLSNLVVFHMDEMLDWQGKELPKNHPLSFRGTMEKLFYGPIKPELNVKEHNRLFLDAFHIEEIKEKIWSAPIDITIGGWGQDGHIAYNQASRRPYTPISIEQMRESSIRVQENNADTIIALAQRNFGTAYQFVPPLSVTLGIKECLSAKKVRLYSDTGAWKQTALRDALFGPITPEFPITLLQEHPNALITATINTASHPFSENPDWDFGLNENDHE